MGDEFDVTAHVGSGRRCCDAFDATAASSR
jgi:hypothetical protein